MNDGLGLDLKLYLVTDPDLAGDRSLDEATASADGVAVVSLSWRRKIPGRRLRF